MADSLENLFTQDELAARFNVSTAALDHYVSFGLLSPKRLNDHFAYTARCALHMEIIQKGQSLGFSLTHIKSLIDQHERR